MTFRKDINGLRALAIIPVILFHSNNDIFTGGFLGVDIFFVISGYLMTGIIITEKRKNNFTFLGFYERRARRLLPALYFVLLLSLFFGSFFLLPFQLKEFGQSLLSSVILISNFFFWIKTNYWSQSAELTPLLHIWSLSVEEQFYLIFPFILIFFRSKKKTFFIIINITIISFLLFLIIRYFNFITESFYLLPFRIWELMLGSLAFFYKPRVNTLFSSIIIKFSFICILVSLIFLNNETNTFLLYFFPTISTFIILTLDNKNGVIFEILSNKYLVFIGTISYSLYLFHQPIFSFSKIIGYSNNNLTLNIILIFIIFLSSFLSYKFIESPFRDKKKINSKKFFTLLIIFSSFLIICGYTLHKTDGLKKIKLSHLDNELLMTFAKFDIINNEYSQIWNEYDLLSTKPFVKNKNNKILIIGDSLSKNLFISALWNNFDKYNSKKANQYRRLKFDDKCAKFFNNKSYFSSNKKCYDNVKNIKQSKLVKDSNIIIIANDWLNNVNYLKNILSSPIFYGKKIIIFKTHAFMDISSFLIYLNNNSIEINSKSFNEFVYLNKHYRTISSNNKLEKIAKKFNLATIDSFNFFCNENLRSCTIFDENHIPMINDQTHLTKDGFIKYSVWFKEEIKNAINK